MSRRSNTEERRTEIVNALLAVISEHGYEKATIQLIAKKAGLTPGLLHYHFKTKAEILLELVKTLADLAKQRYVTFSQSAKTAEERLWAYINSRLAKGEGAEPNAVAAWVMIGAEAVRQPEVRAVYQQAVNTELTLLQRLLSEYLKDRGKRIKNVKRLASGLLALMEGAFQLSCTANSILPTGYAASIAIQLVQRYVDGELKGS